MTRSRLCSFGLVSFLAVAIGFGGLAVPARAAVPAGNLVCFSPAPPGGPATSFSGTTLPPVSPPPSAAGLQIVPPVTSTSSAPTLSLPNIAILMPQPGTGAIVVPVTVSLPSVSGATLTQPGLVLPPTPSPGDNPSLDVSQLLNQLLGPSRPPGSAHPLVNCF